MTTQQPRPGDSAVGRSSRPGGAGGAVVASQSSHWGAAAVNLEPSNLRLPAGPSMSPSPLRGQPNRKVSAKRNSYASQQQQSQNASLPMQSPRSPSNFDIQPDQLWQQNPCSVLIASPKAALSPTGSTKTPTKLLQLQRKDAYGLHGTNHLSGGSLHQHSKPAGGQVRGGRPLQQQPPSGDLVQASALFNARQEQPAVLNQTQVLQQLQRRNLLLPNLHPAAGRGSSTSLQRLGDFPEDKLRLQAAQQPSDIEQFSIVRGLQNQSPTEKKAFTSGHRKASHAVATTVPRTVDQQDERGLGVPLHATASLAPDIGSPTSAAAAATSMLQSNTPQRVISGKAQQALPHPTQLHFQQQLQQPLTLADQLPRIVMAASLPQSKKGRSSCEKGGGPQLLPQHQQQQQFQPQPVDLYGLEFKQWLTPNFQMQGRGIHQGNTLAANIEAVQRVRQQSVMGQASIAALATSPAPPAARRNKSHCESMTARKEQQAPRAGGDQLPNQAAAETRVSNSRGSRQDVAGSKLRQHEAFQQDDHHQRHPMAPGTPGSVNRNEAGGSRLFGPGPGKETAGSRAGSKSSTSDQRLNQRAGESITGSDSSIKQEKQIKSKTQQALEAQHDPMNNFNQAVQNDGGAAEPPPLLSKSQLDSVFTQDDSKNQEAGLTNSELHSPKALQKAAPFINNSKSAARPTDTNAKKPSQQARQGSQAQRNNRNSLVGQPNKARGPNTGKEGSTNNRQIVMNSPLMQPPPQILQSKIIIHLLRTEYPLIEQVAKQDMLWRVTKSENPNQEFDVYWNDIGIDSDRLTSLKPYQKTNHFPAMYHITRKTFLAKNLKRLQKLYPLEFDFFPKTWVLPNELNELRTFATEKAKKPKSPKKAKPDKAASSQAVSPTQTGTDKIITQSSSEQTKDNPLASGGGGMLNRRMSNNVNSDTDSSEAADVEEEDKEVSEEEEDDEAEDGAVKETNNNQTHVTPNATQGNNFGTHRRIGQPRKAPVNCKMNKKSRFPMIVKPDCMSQGKGIFLTHDIESIPRDDTYVVQEYMQNPYLLDGLKFDLRLYVLVLSCEPLKIFLYQEGLVRFATHKYSPLSPNADKQQLNNFYMHLTNYAVNKENENFRMAKGMNDDTSHKRTLKKVLERLKAEGLDTEKVMGETKDVIIKTLICIQQELAHNYRTCQPADLENLMCFEILGFDIILDDKGKPILLEVNQAPSFATDSPLDYEIKKGLFMDTFKLLGLSVEKKKAKLKRLYEEKKDRMMTKLTLKQKNAQRRQAMNEFKKEQDAFEAANHGNFEKIYPLPTKDASESNSQAQEDNSLTPAQKQLAQSQYQALVRQQERYSQLLGTIGNSDVEKAIRAKNRQEDSKQRDDKQKETKLRMKKQERKRIDTQITIARHTSQTNKKAMLASGEVATGALFQPEESIEQAMRESIMKPPGIVVDTNHSYDSKLRQSIGERLTDNKSQTTTSKNKEFAQQHQYLNPTGIHQSGGALQQNYALQRPSHPSYQQVQSQQEHQMNLRESMERAPLDQNMQIRQLIEMQQKLGNLPSGAKTTTFNLVNFGIHQLQQQNVQSLTGRQALNQGKKPIIGSDYLGSPQMIEGLKPNITQLHYQSNISQSQNPINPQRLKSGEFDMKINRMNGQLNNHNRQANLLPNIAKNMIHAEKSSQGFASSATSANQATANSSQNASAMQAIQSTGEYSRGSSKNRQRFRGNTGGHHSATTQQSSSSKTGPGSSTGGGAINSATTKQTHQVVGNEPVSLQSASMQNTSVGLNSPKRHVGHHLERSQYQRSSMQQANGQVPLAMKTQTMNLGVMNIQPVIIDSNHFNTEKIYNQNGSLSSPVKTSSSMPPGSSYKTQKFSKIQLQAIIDNLYQYEGKGQKPKIAQPSVPNAPKDLSKTINLKNGPTVVPAHLMHLPEVNSNENIHKSSNLANRALNAIGQQKIQQQTQVVGDPALSPQFQSSPPRLGSSGLLKAASNEPMSPVNYSKPLGAVDQQRYVVTHRDVHAPKAGEANSPASIGMGSASSPAKLGNQYRSKQSAALTEGAAFAVHGQAYHQPQQQPQPQSQSQTGSPPEPQATSNTTTNVLNFSNCNVTIINNNNGSSSIFEGSPAQAGAAIIQNSLVSRPLNAATTAATFANSPKATKSGGKMSYIQETSGAPMRDINEESKTSNK